tara:strand:+ start:14675 stop:15094 length:420 start_codon:yes stop_codon:yes gene_type:complete
VIKKKDLSQEDKKTWEDFVKNPSDIYDKDKNNLKNNSKQLRFKFDLHGFTLDDANIKVRDIILSCVKKNYKEILLITGKGIHSTNESDVYTSKDFGKLKFSVPEHIRSNKEINRFVVSINEAEIKDGGEGAILIKLKKL